MHQRVVNVERSLHMANHIIDMVIWLIFDDAY